MLGEQKIDLLEGSLLLSVCLAECPCRWLLPLQRSYLWLVGRRCDRLVGWLINGSLLDDLLCD